MNNSEILGYVGKSISDFEPRYFNNLYDTDYHLMIVLVDGVYETFITDDEKIIKELTRARIYFNCVALLISKTSLNINQPDLIEWYNNQINNINDDSDNEWSDEAINSYGY